MDTATVGLYFVFELVRNVCLLMDDSVVSKIIFACVDVVFLIVLNLHRTTSGFSTIFRLYTIISFCQTLTTLVYKILNKHSEWLTYFNISVAAVDAVIVALIVGREILAFFRSKRFAEAMNKKLIIGQKTI